MCGIAGIFEYEGHRPVDREAVKRMTEAIRHRGPDDEGFFFSQEIGLGMRRLSIIDLAGGHQPISNEDESLVIVFNGEIYNFPELRKSLIDRGHHFKTRTDTEVALHLYEELGEASLEKLDGMFAFALWDKARKRLVLARDRMGEKPLYFSDDRGKLVFGSEMGALLAHSETPQELDLEALHHYLTFLSVPAPLSIFRKVRKLGPAQVLVCDSSGIRVRAYWKPQPRRFDGELRESALAEELRELMGRAVRTRLISDVPLGVFLSGGLDSSTIVALMAGDHVTPIETFSVGFEEKEFNELHDAALVARRFGTTHHELVLRPDMLAVIPELLQHFGEPFAVGAAVPLYYLSRLARERVKVVLTGDGGDEVFGGYPWYAWQDVLGRIPGAAPRALERFLRVLPRNRKNRVFDRLRQAHKWLSGATLGPERKRILWGYCFSEAAKEALYTEEVRQATAHLDSADVLRQALRVAPAEDVTEALIHIDLSTYLPNEMLVKSDRTTMLHSLEGRSPFLMPDLVEFMLGLPTRAKVEGGRLKTLFRKAVSPLLPDATLRKKKQGLNLPMGSWFRSAFKTLAGETLAEERLRREGIFRPEAVASMIAVHNSGREDFSKHLWALVCFEIWAREVARKRPETTVVSVGDPQQ